MYISRYTKVRKKKRRKYLRWEACPMKKVSTNTRLHISSDMRHAYHTKTYDLLHIMTRLNPFGRGRKYEIINVLVDTFYLICNMPTLSDLRIFHWLTPPHPRRVPKVDGDFLLFNFPAFRALYYVTMFSSSYRSHGAFRALYPAPTFIGDIAPELSVFNQF
jgi:hypothetical protein